MRWVRKFNKTSVTYTAKNILDSGGTRVDALIEFLENFKIATSNYIGSIGHCELYRLRELGH